MVYQFRLTNGNFKRNVTFNETNTIGDIVNYLESNYTKTTSNRIKLFKGKTFFTNESQILKDCGFKSSGIIRLTFTENYDGGN
jgi:hypothetical protein